MDDVGFVLFFVVWSIFMLGFVSGLVVGISAIISSSRVDGPVGPLQAPVSAASP